MAYYTNHSATCFFTQHCIHFNCCIEFHCMNIPSFIYPFPYWWTSRLFPFLYSYNVSAILVHIFLGTYLRVWRRLQSTHIFTLPNCSPKWWHQFTLPRAEHESFLCSTSSQTHGVMSYLKLLPIWWVRKTDSQFLTYMSCKDNIIDYLDHLFNFHFFSSFYIALWFHHHLSAMINSTDSLHPGCLCSNSGFITPT